MKWSLEFSNMMAHSLAALNCSGGSAYLDPSQYVSKRYLGGDTLEFPFQCYCGSSRSGFAGGGTFTNLQEKCPVVQGLGDYEAYGPSERSREQRDDPHPPIILGNSVCASLSRSLSLWGFEWLPSGIAPYVTGWAAPGGEEGESCGSGAIWGSS